MPKLFAQAQASRWIVGRYAGVNFTTRPASAILTANTLFTPGEGGASIADASGNLLFYTDGTQIFDRRNAVMPNSTSLGGHISSSQSALIVRKPGSLTLYYVFTTDAIEKYPSSHRGLRYSVVDMALNGGYGDVQAAQKSVLLQTQTAEKLTACFDSGGQNVWILSHGFGNALFYANKLSANGLALDAVISTAGAAHGALTGGNFNPGRGCMKVSPDGSHIATVVLPAYGGQYIAELFNFDIATGYVSFAQSLSEPATDPNTYNFYGVEFSASGSKMYISSRKGPYHIYQYDLCASDIRGSKTTVATSTNEFGTLQLAPDGKLYCAKNSDQYLGTINQPEIAATGCTYVDHGFNLTGRTSTYGLTNLNQSLFYKPQIRLGSSSACAGSPTTFTLTFIGCNPGQGQHFAYQWSFADPSSGGANTGTGANPAHTYLQGGQRRVILTYSWGAFSDTASVVINAPSQHHLQLTGGDTSHCPGRRGWRAAIADGATLSNWGLHITGESRFSGVLSRDSLTCACTDGEHVTALATGVASDGCPTDSLQVRINIHTDRLAPPIGPSSICLLDPSQAIVLSQPTAVPNRWLWDADTIPAAPTLEQRDVAAGNHAARLVPSANQPPGVCISTSDALMIHVSRPEKLSFETADSAFCPDAPLGVYTLPTSVDSILWSVTGGQIRDVQRPQTSVEVVWDAAGPYMLTASGINVAGCPRAQTKVFVEQKCLEVDNIITQNSDFKNDGFHVKNIEGYPDNTLKIYNRWGMLVAERQTFNNDLTQTFLKGTYFYELAVKTGTGHKLYKGWVEVTE